MASLNHMMMAMVSFVLAIFIGQPSFADSSNDACLNCPTNDIYDKLRMERFADVPVMVWTDRDLYGYGSDIIVYGKVANFKPVPITITVYDPQNNVVGVEQISVSDSNSFETTLKASGSLWNKNGPYTIRAQYGSQEVHHKTTIRILGTPNAPVVCNEDQFKVIGESESYCISYDTDNIKIKNALVSGDLYSILLTLDAPEDGSLILMIPRDILDSKSSSSDSPFIVTADDQPLINVYEIHSDDRFRTLEIEIPENTRELEIIGTFAVPEFGTIAIVILGAAILMMIVTRKNLIRFPSLQS